jgi:hypothetical protein
MILVGKPKRHLSRATLSTISPHVLAWVLTEASVMRDHGTALFPGLFLPFVTHTFALLSHHCSAVCSGCSRLANKEYGGIFGCKK